MLRAAVAVQIHTEGGRALGRALRTNTALCSLGLRLNRLGDEGGRAVVDALRHHPRLERLDLGCNGLAAFSAKALTKCLPFNGVLREVGLLGNQFGVEGGAAVRAAVEGAPALEVCSLAHCGLADADLQAVQVRGPPAPPCHKLLHRWGLSHQAKDKRIGGIVASDGTHKWAEICGDKACPQLVPIASLCCG